MAAAPIAIACLLAFGVVAQAQDPSDPLCRITGRIASGGTPLPGVAVTITRGESVVAATSTDGAGAYRLRVPPGEYRLASELAAFARAEREVSVASDACDTVLDLTLVLLSRAPQPEPSTAGGEAGAPEPGSRDEGAEQARQPIRGRFAALEVLESEIPDLTAFPDSIDAADPAARLLPAGFSPGAATEVVAVNGESAAIDRGQLRDRLEALGRGEFDPAGAQRPDGFGGPGPVTGRFGGAAGQGGQGAGPVGGGRGGFLGRGRGQNRIQGQATYTFGGSILDASPYALRAGTDTDPAYARHQVGGTVGGPFRLPGLYDGSRTTFFLNYSGGRSTNLHEQYATVPTAAIRAGDFSAADVRLIDPATGQPFPGNRIPAERIDPAAHALFQFFPEPNLPGTSLNYRSSTTAATTADTISVRLTHNFTGTAGRRGGGSGGRSGGFGGRGGGGAGPTGTAVVLNAQVQYRQSDTDDVNVFPLLGGTHSSSTIAAPVALNVLRGRTIHNIRASVNRSSSASHNRFAHVVDVAAAAGLTGVATDPSSWGVPTISFSSVTDLRDVAPDERSDTRVQAAYTLTRPFERHTLRVGGDFRRDMSDGHAATDARGTFVFTGLYTSGGGTVGPASGLDFADFLLGLPQQASVALSPEVKLRGQAFNVFAQDDWRLRGNLTLNLGVRYEVVRPYTEADGRLANLDVAPGFSAVAPVISGGVGAYTGPFPAALINPDTNNIAPRLGVAWRATPRTIVRGGYGISFNNGAYASIARQLAAQPPFVTTNTIIGSLTDPLALSDALVQVETATTTNTFGVDKDYQLGVIHTWNLDVNRNAGRGWQVGAGYTGTRGAYLDVLRAPNRDPDGLRLEDVQPFIWQTSEGSSMLHAATVRVRRQQTRGLSGSFSYTLAKSMDNASSIGGGARVVAQDDRNLEAEWGLSSFDRRHQLTANMSVELPFGDDRRWLSQGGLWAVLLGDWSISGAFSAQSGTPFTARIVGASADVARGTNGTLRADYTGALVALDDPTLRRFFNTDAFTIPAAGTFGNAGRNTIIGPDHHQLDAMLTRDVRLTGNQAVTIRLEATNLLNSVQYASIDTVVNSPTFGQVVSMRPMRTVQLNVRFRF